MRRFFGFLWKFIYYTTWLQLIALGIWLIWPVSPRTMPSYVSLPPERASTPAEFQAVVDRACEGELLQLIGNALKDAGIRCSDRLFLFEEQLQGLVEAKAVEGVQLDAQNCVARDSQGEVSDLGTLIGEVPDVFRLYAQGFYKPVLREGMGRKKDRLILVGLCSVRKSLHYWSVNPEHIPAADEVPHYLYFDPRTLKPEKNYYLSLYLDFFTALLRSH